MLKQESMPIWVLADCLIVLLVAGSLIAASVLPLVAQHEDTENALQVACENVEQMNQQLDSHKRTSQDRDRKIGQEC